MSEAKFKPGPWDLSEFGFASEADRVCAEAAPALYEQVEKDIATFRETADLLRMISKSIAARAMDIAADAGEAALAQARGDT